MVFWKKKVLSDDYVELSIGRVYFKVITNGMLNKITTNASPFGILINNLFFQLFEYEVLNLSRKKIDNLSIVDGNKVREKLKEVLLRHGILESDNEVVEKEANIFDKTDVNWFDNKFSDFNNKLKVGAYNGRGR